jgi:hypothetical protein
VTAGGGYLADAAVIGGPAVALIRPVVIAPQR